MAHKETESRQENKEQVRKAKFYRFDKEGNQWEERGVGTVKLLKHKKSGKVKLVMRQNKMCQPSGASNIDHPRTCGK
ncbi:hypothetical protein Leryth_009085 [Lithospermum erythrorhizon]|nr:hypothetical protein Leryth_009085 [Lithospermum erythrorhizon]